MQSGVAGLTGTAETLHVPIVHAGSFTFPNPVEAVHNIYEDMAAGLQYHELECHSHPYSSVWFTWPITEHPVLFYFETGTNGTPVNSISNLGNPALWWLSILPSSSASGAPPRGRMRGASPSPVWEWSRWSG